MTFIVEWLWYLLAFVVGSVTAWLLGVLFVKYASKHEAIAALPGSREIGVR